MTKEDKELLMKDLSCRIPYGVIVKIDGMSKIVKLTSVSYYGEVGVDDGSTYLYPISEVKPYLFPLSIISNRTLEKISAFVDAKTSHVILEFFNSRHIDYRGLIKKGLAIDAADLNIY